MLAHRLGRELQMATKPADRSDLAKRPARWEFESLGTIRQHLLHNAGTLTRPQGVCANGACAPWYDHVDPCPPGLTNCGRGGEIECVDLEGDVLHCGSCANQCSPEADCVDGVCVFPQGHHEVIYE